MSRPVPLARDAATRQALMHLEAAQAHIARLSRGLTILQAIADMQEQGNLLNGGTNYMAFTLETARDAAEGEIKDAQRALSGNPS